MVRNAFVFVFMKFNHKTLLISVVLESSSIAQIFIETAVSFGAWSGRFWSQKGVVLYSSEKLRENKRIP